MAYDFIVISSGHSKYVRGASGIIDEVDEARLVVDRVAEELRKRDIEVIVYHDDVSKTQNENLHRIVDFHNSKKRDLDISVHFNASSPTAEPRGTEVFYYSQEELADQVSAAIASVGFKDRGGKLPEESLFFLSNTEEPAILVEVCFVDSSADCDIYADRFDDICERMAVAIAGIAEAPPQPDDNVLFHETGTCSYFGGPEDDGVSSSEGLAFHSVVHEDNQHLFLPLQPQGTSGLARRLNAKAVHYVACRWDYAVTPKTMLAGSQVALVINTETGRGLTAFPADWGPHTDTGRIADLSPALMADLGLETDDTVEVIYPYRGD